MAYESGDLFGADQEFAPSVIGAEHVAELDTMGEVPESVFLPSERVTSRDAEVTLELRDTAEGNRAMLAFTSLQALVEGCGDCQPWVQVRGHLVDDLRQRSGADVTLWDTGLPVEERRTG